MTLPLSTQLPTSKCEHHPWFLSCPPQLTTSKHPLSSMQSPFWISIYPHLGGHYLNLLHDIFYLDYGNGLIIGLSTLLLWALPECILDFAAREILFRMLIWTSLFSAKNVQCTLNLDSCWLLTFVSEYFPLAPATLNGLQPPNSFSHFQAFAATAPSAWDHPSYLLLFFVVPISTSWFSIPPWFSFLLGRGVFWPQRLCWVLVLCVCTGPYHSTYHTTISTCIFPVSLTQIANL